MQDKVLVTRATHGLTAARAMDGEGVGSYDIPLPDGTQIMSLRLSPGSEVSHRSAGLPEVRLSPERIHTSRRLPSGLGFQPSPDLRRILAGFLILQRSGPSPGAPLHPVRNLSAT
jgi:hypothetical protein